MPPPRIHLDASVLKHAVQTRMKEWEEPKTVRWGGEVERVGKLVDAAWTGGCLPQGVSA